VQLVVISGLSGGGKSTALRALEDLGMFCVDNCPIPLLPQLVALVRGEDPTRGIAVCADARDTEHLASFDEVCERLERACVKIDVLFVDAARQVLVRRFAETRRMHPMGDLPEAIDREREALAQLRARATTTIDSSNYTGRQLRQLVRDRYASGAALRVVLQSFAFKQGVPSEADLVFDARFLDNPHDDANLRPLSGLHEPVARRVLEQPDAVTLIEMIESMVRFVVPRVLAEGRSYLTVAVGCTGGQHRSVSIVEELKVRIADLGHASSGGTTTSSRAAGVRVLVRHRDVGSGT
jgi:UPF0042 nucleotide-binding protein